MTEARVARIVGYTGTIEFDGESVTILRENLLGRLSHGWKPRVLPLSRMERVDIELPKWGEKGSIWFSMPGEDAENHSLGHNSVMFLKKQQEEFLALYGTVKTALRLLPVLELRSLERTADEIIELQRAAASPPPEPSSAPPSLPAEGGRAPEAAPVLPVADQLLKLKELYDAGVLTHEEYSAKAAPLIERL